MFPGPGLPYASEVVDVSGGHHAFAARVNALHPKATGVVTAQLRGDSTARDWQVEAGRPLLGDFSVVRAPVGDVVQAGAGPAVTAAGTPDATRDFVVEITTGGALGVGQYRWSKDGGQTWDESGLTLAASDVLGTTGITASFAAGTYVIGTRYSWGTGLTDLLAAGDVLGLVEPPP